MNDWATRSFWLGRGDYAPSVPLDGDTRADVVMMGGGFTSLWSAIQLKEADPSIDVVILERDVIGYGASGRNGGFGMTMIARNIHDLLRKVGKERARATHLAMVETLEQLESFCAAEGIEADITHPGLLTVSNGPEQDIRIGHDLDAAEKLGLDDFRALDRGACRELVRTDCVRCGHFEQHSLLVDPAALARGLKRAALSRGVRIYEGTAAESISAERGKGVVAKTATGTVSADRGLIATNAYAHAIPRLRPFLFTIYAYIVLTERLTPEQWARVGWERRMGIEDKRIMPHFHRPTADGRILWGGRDAPFKAGGPDARFDRDERIFARLEETFRWTFPQLSDVGIEHAWAGPVCGTIHCFATVGRLDGERLHYALGYAGHGVGPSHLVGKIVRDMMLDRKTELLELPMVAVRPARLPPEPLRGLVLRTAQTILLEADDSGGRSRNPFVKLALRFLQ